MSKKLKILINEPLLLIALPVSLITLLLIVIARPFVSIRIGFLRCDRIGHFASNTELYLCERDINKNSDKTLDLFYYPRKVCNQQLASMWERKLHVLPWFWLRPLCLIIRTFDCLTPHRVIESRGGSSGLDVDNLQDRLPPHLEFTPKEEARGEAAMCAMGIQPDTPFICLIARDSTYLEAHYPGASCSYQNYRDSDIQNYILAAEELADRGYVVIRMGAKAREAIKTTHPRVIDYATNGMRSDFLDIYLSAKCSFFISGESGLARVPMTFRVPLVIVNSAAIEYTYTWSNNIMSILKKHWLEHEKRFMTFKEVFDSGAGRFLHTEQYEQLGIELIENSPEDIATLAIEMDERLKGTWETTEEDEKLQRRFWDVFPKSELCAKEVKARIGADFLRQNRELLD